LQVMRTTLERAKGTSAVIVYRATAKLLARLGEPVTDPPSSTTVLGDWYVKPFSIAQRRFIVLASEHSRIAVLMPGRDVAGLARNFPPVMAQLLIGLGIPEDAVAREVEACQQYAVATTAGNKSMLGTLNDHATMTQYRLRHIAQPDLAAESISLSHSPMSPLGFKFGADVARGLFGLDPLRPARPF
jgi:hypothetical protein